MNRRTLIWTTILIALLAALFLLGNQLLTQLETSWPAVAAAIALLIVALAAAINLLANLNDATDFVGKLTGRNPRALKPEQEQRLRQALILRMQTRCREGLDNRLQEAVWKIELGFNQLPDAVRQPRTMDLRSKQGESKPLPTGTSIHTIFQDLGGSLLILGQPGAGKTTTLLELGQALLPTDTNINTPIPIYFNLASWAIERKPLEEWLIDELSDLYRINKRLAVAWLQDTPFNIFLLLDGLDEVKREHQAACVKAINTFTTTHGPIKTAVCCRVKEYDQIQKTQPLDFPNGSAVIIQPLQTNQINQYFRAGGSTLQNVHDAVNSNLWLRELAGTPLFLNVIAFAFRNRPVNLTNEDMKRQLWAAYIDRAFEHRASSGTYTRAQATHWLTYLATQLTHYEITEFYIERLQPTWLHSQKRYTLIVRLLFGLSIWLFFRQIMELGDVPGISEGLIFVLFFALIFALIFVLNVGLVRDIKPMEKIKFNWKAGLLFGLLFGLMGGLVVGLSIGLIVGLIVGQSIERYTSDNSDLTNKILPNEGIWQSGKFGLSNGLIIGLISGLSIGLSGALISGLRVGLSFGLIGGLLLGLLPFFQHFVLRLLLSFDNYLPWKLPQFLDEMTSLTLLQQFGGGYKFLHNTLRDHLADQ